MLVDVDGERGYDAYSDYISKQKKESIFLMRFDILKRFQPRKAGFFLF